MEEFHTPGVIITVHATHLGMGVKDHEFVVSECMNLHARMHETRGSRNSCSHQELVFTPEFHT